MHFHYFLTNDTIYKLKLSQVLLKLYINSKRVSILVEAVLAKLPNVVPSFKCIRIIASFS